MWVPVWLAIAVVIAVVILVIITAVAAASVHRSEALILQLQLRVKALQLANKDRAEASLGRLVRP